MYHPSFLWQGAEGAISRRSEVTDTVDQFLKFAEQKTSSSHWCPDVVVLKAFCQACKVDQLIISVMLADCRTRGIPFGHDQNYSTYLPRTEDFVMQMWHYCGAYLHKIRNDLRTIGEWDRRGRGRRARSLFPNLHRRRFMVNASRRGSQ